MSSIRWLWLRPSHSLLFLYLVTIEFRFYSSTSMLTNGPQTEIFLGLQQAILIPAFLSP